ncbi:STAS domain-containing protein [Mycobacterium cookii]|uniref:STAS domain-containing protein n=1 Tax=Mycobacterium cookii TaxID=1775 RepID=UPI0013D2D249|nr:STAS domain-containing protein [Mycobacterium cookii]MCV7330095.1 STAS domain-containing protein [Mycobacterium cookii]
MSRNNLVSTSVTYHDGIAVLAIGGEIDLASIPAVDRAIAEVLAEEPPALIVDLLGVQFIGSVGISALVTAALEFGDDRCFSVVAQGPMTSRIIQRLDLDDLLSLKGTVEEAIGWAKDAKPPIAAPDPIPREPTG